MNFGLNINAKDRFDKMREELLKIIADKERVITDNIEEKYLSDSLGRKKGTAKALVFPASTEEVSGVMKYAYEHNIPITPRGAGTNLVGSTVPKGEGIVLDFSNMNRILELDKETFTATVEPGAILEDFQAYVEKQGLFYPPDPGEKRASIGGTISTNAGGMRAVKYGVTRDYVMGLELVLPDGSVITTGSKNRKDTTGLDLKDLVIGSEGTLAIITKCILKLIPKPESSVSILVGYESLKAGIESVAKILNANLNPTATEFIERKVVKLGEDFLNLSFPIPAAKAYLLLTFDGVEDEINSRIRRLKAVLKTTGAIEVLELRDSDTLANAWRIRGCLVKAVEAVSEQEPLDIVVPINNIDKFVNFVNEFEKQCGMRMISFGHAGDGNVHLCVLRENRDEDTWVKELDDNLTVIYDKANELGGLVSGEHGIGLSKQKYFKRTIKSENIALMKRIKTAFDDRHILNAGISYDI